MFQYFVVLLVVAAKCDATLIEDSPKTTTWVHVLTPRTNYSTVETPPCSGRLTVTRKVNQMCTCGNSAAPLLKVSFPDGVQGEFPFISVDTEAEIRAAINVRCVCSDGVADGWVMGKELEQDFAFFASCEKNSAIRGGVACWPEIFARSAPSAARLQEVKRSVKYINKDWKTICVKDDN